MVPYHDLKPRPAEEDGFMAAGILLVNDQHEVLMIREVRVKDGIQRAKFNFIGGKRECRLDCFGLPMLESGFETASTEFEEETGIAVPTTRYSTVYWFPESKYLLFVVQGTIPLPNMVEWFSRSAIEDGLKNHIFHDYIVPQVRAILDT